MEEYLVQAILVDDSVRGQEQERVVNSLRTANYEEVVDSFMRMHKSSNKYLYVAMSLRSQEVVYKSKDNKYFLWK